MLDHVSDDYIYRNRHLGLKKLSQLFRVPESQISRALRERGWVRGSGNRHFKKMPCMDCGKVFDADQHTRHRLCEPCLNGETPLPELTDELINDPKKLLRRERTRVRRKRQKVGERMWNDRYLRPRWPIGEGQ